MSQWPMVKLGDVCRPVSNRGDKNGLEVYSVTKHNGFVLSREYFKKQVFSKNTKNYKICETDDFAYATIHLDEGSIGFSPERCLISPMYTVFRPDYQKVDKTYLLYLLKSKRSIAQYSILGSGSVERRKSIKFNDLAKLQFPLPPLEEQQRIARLLNTSSTSIKLAKNELSATRNLVLQTTLSQVDETNRSIPLSEIVCIRGGMTPSKKDKSYWNGDINWFSSKDLKQDYLNRSADRITEKAVSSNSLRPTKTVGIAISIRGMSLAHTVPMSIIPAGSCVNQDLKILTPKNQISTDTLLQILKIKQPELLSRVSSSAHGTKKLDLRHLEALEIPDLTSDEYSWLQSFISKVRQVDFLLSTRLTLLEELHQSLATRAFAGQL